MTPTASATMDPEIATMLEAFHAGQRAQKSAKCRWCGHRATASSHKAANRKIIAHMRAAHPGGPEILTGWR